jgi:glucokinase
VAGLDELKRSLLAAGTSILGAVVAFPGPVAYDVVRAAPTLWPGERFAPFSLRDRLEELWADTPIVVVNDVSAAGYAYAARDAADFCIVTVSSGIGHKVFVHGEPLVGPTGAGGEIGHVALRHGRQGVMCDCGGIDHVGAISSGRGILNLVRERAGRDAGFASSGLGRACGSPAEITNERVAEAFRVGDRWTVETVRTGVEPLAWALGLVRALVGIERFIIVGGFADALGPGFCEELARAAGSGDWDGSGRWEHWIVPGDLRDSAGLLGAGAVGARAWAHA